MLVARAPFRISYAGGGTDIDSYYMEHGGMVVSAAIDKYFYVIVTPDTYGSLQVSSSDYRVFLRYEGQGEAMGIGGELKHAEVAIERFGLTSGYSIFMASQVPAGSGLGSSSAVAVALVKALSTLQRRQLSRSEVAEAACDLELGKLKMPIGRQDQYASAFGGVNAIAFTSGGVRVEPLDIDPDTVSELERSTLLFYTGMSHNSSQILEEQQRNASRAGSPAVEALHRIRDAAGQARDAIVAGDIAALGEVMHAAWQDKKTLSARITNEQIDSAYEAARRAGAAGGKIAGAGGGGFLMLICPPARQAAVTAALHAAGLMRFDFHFDFAGARVLMNNAAD